MTRIPRITAAVGGALCVVATGIAAAESIHTGGAEGSYHNDICPSVRNAIAPSYFRHRCRTSAGTGENIARVLESPADIGIGQADLLATLSGQETAGLQVVDPGIGKECLYAVTRNHAIEDLTGLSPRTPVVLPPAKSGSAATFASLQALDPTLGSLRAVTNAESTTAAIASVVTGTHELAFFVQLPDTANAVFRQINEAGLSFVPVISRAILRQRVGDTPLFEAMNVNVTPQGLVSRLKREEAPSIETACTPIVLFTGSADGLSGVAAEDNAELVARLAETKPPEGDRWADMAANLEAMTASAIGRLTGR